MIYDDYLLHYLGTLGTLGTLGYLGTLGDLGYLGDLDGDLVEDLDVSILLF
jgi:hypothetical protein